MSGPKSLAYQPSAEELARRAEESALLQATSRFRVLCAELDAVRRVSAATSTAFGRPIDLLASPELVSGSSSEVDGQNAALERMLAEARALVHATQRHAEAERLADFLGTLGELEDTAVAPTSVSSSSPASEQTLSVRARADRYLETLLPGAHLSERATDLAGGLATAPPELAPLALRDLQAEIGRINRAARREAMWDLRLKELDVRAGALGHSGLLRDILVARDDLGDVTEDRVVALERRVADEETAAAAVKAREAARIAMERALLAEGYEVLQGFDTAVPRDGVLVRKPGLDFHAWRVAVDDDSIHLDVVRTGLEVDPRMSIARDVEAETRICADLPVILDRIAGEGVAVGRVRQLAPGDCPVAVLPNAKPVQQSIVSGRVPEERSR